MSELQQQIIRLVKDQIHQFTGIRRHLHEYPELSFEETNTCAYITELLNNWGIENKVVAETGVHAVIRGRNPDKMHIALRGDIDGLPITENTGLAFSSKNKGVMHACGHD
ncbi:MAG TPA: amidohydrolase, partial [Flavobacteriales bacterium]|nr:amidohydrolase [Flavobacteriales bacterium]